jgi:hypothetical protein
MKLTNIDKGAIAAFIVLLFMLPITNGYMAVGVDVLFTQIALIGRDFIQVPGTLLVVYVIYKFAKQKPAKTKGGKDGIKYETTGKK